MAGDHFRVTSSYLMYSSSILISITNLMLSYFTISDLLSAERLITWKSRLLGSFEFCFVSKLSIEANTRSGGWIPDRSFICSRFKLFFDPTWNRRASIGSKKKMEQNQRKRRTQMRGKQTDSRNTFSVLVTCSIQNSSSLLCYFQLSLDA